MEWRIESQEELPDNAGYMVTISECHDALTSGGRMLIAEPRGHVDENEFEATCEISRECGFIEADAPKLRKSFSALFEK